MLFKQNENVRRQRFQAFKTHFYGMQCERMEYIGFDVNDKTPLYLLVFPTFNFSASAKRFQSFPSAIDSLSHCKHKNPTFDSHFAVGF